MNFKELKYRLLGKSGGAGGRIPFAIVKTYMKYRRKKGNISSPYICLAPFNSMRFNRSGSVTPCCQNYNLDTLNDKTLNTVWQGEAYEKLRTYIKRNDLSFFCDFCALHLKNKNFAAVLAQTYDYHPLNDNGMPSYMEFSTDNTCNLSCVMCNSSLSDQKKSAWPMPTNKPFRYSKSFYDELTLFLPHLRAVNFSGGEPFLINDYYKIWDLINAINPGLPISVTTNGTVLSDRVKQTLDKGRFNICVSIDSLKKEVYEAIRVNAHLEKTLKNIDYFKAYCERKNTNFSFTICPMRMNAEEMPFMVQYANDKNIPINFNIVTKPFEQALWTMPAEDIESLLEFYSSFGISSDNQVRKNNKEKFDGLIMLCMQWETARKKIDKSYDKVNLTAERAKLNAIVKGKIEKALLLKNVKDKETVDNLMLETKTEAVLANIPELLFAINIHGVFEKLPDKFVFDEFYYQSVETTLDNICALCYYSI